MSKSKRMTKSEILTAMAAATDSDKRTAGAMLDALESIMVEALQSSAGEFVLPGLLKLQTVKKPATKARDGKNPFTGESIRIAAKPASKKVKARPLARLKASV